MNYNYIKDDCITGKYVSYNHLNNILLDYNKWLSKTGYSENNLTIPLYQIGKGDVRILLWSQMHGNESTTTRALIDIFKIFSEQDYLFYNCELYIIPMLNPDGANLYTRENFNHIDLNRDAINLSQKESLFLRSVFEDVKPDFCFNLHDQRTIFGVGEKPATVSFLAPAADESRRLTEPRTKAMKLIAELNNYLQKLIPNQVGRFDDSFNANCTGDQFTLLGVPTILIESGFFPNDYQREETRKYVALSILKAVELINNNTFEKNTVEEYFKIPENHKNFRDFCFIDDISGEKFYFQLEEQLIGDRIIFTPKIVEGTRQNYYAHNTYSLSDIYPKKFSQREVIIDYILEYLTKEVQKYNSY